MYPATTPPTCAASHLRTPFVNLYIIVSFHCSWPHAKSLAILPVSMEAIGSAASIVQLISLTGSVLASGYNFLSKVKRAPSEIRTLLRETASLKALLHELQAVADASGTPTDENTNSALDTLYRLGVFEDCQSLMKIVERSIMACEQVQGEELKNLGKKITWPFREKETNSAISQLARLRDSLNAAVVVDSA